MVPMTAYTANDSTSSKNDLQKRSESRLREEVRDSNYVKVLGVSREEYIQQREQEVQNLLKEEANQLQEENNARRERLRTWIQQQSPKPAEQKKQVEALEKIEEENKTKFNERATTIKEGFLKTTNSEYTIRGEKALNEKFGKSNTSSSASALHTKSQVSTGLNGANLQQEMDVYATTSRNDARLIEKNFEREKSIEARAYTRNRQKTDEMQQEVLAMQQEQMYQEALQIQLAQQAYLAQRAAQAKKHAVASRMLGRRGLAPFTRWMGIGVAATAFSIQFLFGMISLVAFGIKYVVEATALGRLAAWVAEKLSGVISIFTSFADIVSPTNLAYAAWAIATIIAVGIFFGFLLWYHLTGIRVFHSTLSILITALCFALSILPVTNLLPWLVIWVIYINTTALFSNMRHT